MKISIEVKSEKITEINGISQKTGRPYAMRKQTGWLDLGKDYPSEVELNLEANQPPYKAGFYILAPESFYVDRNKNICIRPVLQLPSAPVLEKKAS